MGGTCTRGPPTTACLSSDVHWCDPRAGGCGRAEIRTTVPSGWRQSMNAEDSVLRFISRMLVRHALRACPPGRAKWIAAASNEIDSITSSYEVFTWSLGTVWASYKERFCAMSIAEPQVPKLLLTLEVLTCFLPSSLLWIWTLKATTNHMLPVVAALSLATAALIGPAGLVFFGQVALGISGSRGKDRSLALIFLATWSAVVILLLPSTPTPFKELPWRDCVLFIVLPMIGAAHFAFLERRAQSMDAENTLQGRL